MSAPRTVRAVLHCHSDWSYDGSWSLPDLARFFCPAGAAAVMMTEHDTGFAPESFAAYRAACAEASVAGCRLIPGIEYSCPDNDIHILTWGLDRFLAEHRPVAETLAAVAEAGGAAVFAHPVRRDAWRLFDPGWVPHLAAIEVWNRKSDGIAPGARAEALVAETGLPVTVGCDFHRLKHYWPLTNRISVAGDDLEAGLVAGLRAGEMVPEVFGRSMLDAAGGLAPLGLSRRAEGLRRRLAGLKRRVAG